MEDKKYFEITFEDGKTQKYEIITAFKLAETGKYYLVFTDDLTKNEINIYAANYDPSDDTKFEQIKTAEEWQIIKSQVNRIFPKTKIKLKKEKIN